MNYFLVVTGEFGKPTMYGPYERNYERELAAHQMKQPVGQQFWIDYNPITNLLTIGEFPYEHCDKCTHMKAAIRSFVKTYHMSSHTMQDALVKKLQEVLDEEKEPE